MEAWDNAPWVSPDARVYEVQPKSIMGPPGEPHEVERSSQP
jgi:hypothetical protein